MNEKKPPHSKLYIFSSVFLLLTVFLCFFVAIQILTNGYASIGGYSTFRVVTGSMEPAIPTGALLLNKKTDISEIEKNDIICFKARIDEIRGEVITHRVTEVLQDEQGNIYLETRGDANLATDRYYVDETNLIGRVTWHSGKESALSDMLSFLTGKVGFIACIVIPLLVVSGLIFQGAVQNIQKDITQLREELRRGAKAGSSEPEDAALPGFETLRQSDYDEIYETLKQELMRDVYGLVEGSDSKTE